MKGPLFPAWQVDRGEYEVTCSHLGLTPNAAIFDRLQRHLADAPFDHPPPRGLARVLALPRLTTFRVARLDIASRLFFRDHPVRHVLNAVIALHECTGDGWRELSRSATGARAWLAIVAWVLRWVIGVAVTLPWLAAVALRWKLSATSARASDLQGRQVLITGVARGLGHDLMLECLERGASVVGTVRNHASRRALLQELSTKAALTLVVADLAVPGHAAIALDAAGVAPGGLAMVVLCAGTKHDGSTVLDLDALRDTVQVNLLACAEVAAWRCAAEPAPAALVVISSIGRWHGMHSTAGYNASKAALSIWAESLDMELARRPGPRPTVSIVEPGLFESGMSQRGHRLLQIPRRELARAILDAALAGRRALRRPRWFALLTWGLCLAGRRVRERVFATVKTASPPQ